jgi:hypothetical protein
MRNIFSSVDVLRVFKFPLTSSETTYWEIVYWASSRYQFITLTNCMEQSPCWETDNRSAGQKFPTFYGTWRFVTMFTRAYHCPEPEGGSWFQFPGEGGGWGPGNFSLLHRVQTGSGSHPATYWVDTVGSFPGGKSSGAWSWPLTSF